MASAWENDQLNLQMIVRVLLRERILIDRNSQLWEILTISYADIKTAEDQYRAGLINIGDLFTKMISSWKSKTNGSPKDLYDILIENGFKTAAGKLHDNFFVAIRTVSLFLS
jgi:hypothetical protein